MGQSIDAILVWGFDIGSEDEFDEPLSARISYLNEDGYDELATLEKVTGAELITHCSCSYPMYIVGVSKTKTRAYRGHPKEIESLELDVDEGQAALAAFSKALGIEAKEGRWILASNWC